MDIDYFTFSQFRLGDTEDLLSSTEGSQTPPQDEPTRQDLLLKRLIKR